MCGIFGFAGEAGKMSLKRVTRLAEATEQRGPHAFGFAWVDGRNRLHCFKQTGRITDHLGLLAMARGAKALIGHCRYATHGSPEANINNHPHPCDGGWLVHNGVVRNAEALRSDHDLHPQSECDSEILAQLIERLPGDPVERCLRAANFAEPNALVLAALWTRPVELVLVRRGNPLHWERRGSGLYFGSLAEGLGKGGSVPDNTVAEISITKTAGLHVEAYRF